MSNATSLNTTVVAWALSNGWDNPSTMVAEKAKVLDAYNAAHSGKNRSRKNSKKFAHPIVQFRDGRHEDIVLDPIPFRKADVAMAVYGYIMANHEALGMTFDKEDLSNVVVSFREVPAEPQIEKLGGLLSLVENE